MRWRALFGVKLYNAMPSPHFPSLLRAITHVGISSLRLLQMRFWHVDHLPLFTRMLEFVSQHRIAKHVIQGALTGWEAVQIHRVAAEDDTVVDQFAKRVETYMRSKNTQKRIRAAKAVLTTHDMQAIRQLQHVRTVAQEPPVEVAAAAVAASTSSSHALFPASSADLHPPPDLPPPVMVERVRTPRALPPPPADDDVIMTTSDAAEPVTFTSPSPAEQSPPRPIRTKRPASEGPAPAVEMTSNRAAAASADAAEPPLKRLRNSSSVAVLSPAATVGARASASASVDRTSGKAAAASTESPPKRPRTLVRPSDCIPAAATSAAASSSTSSSSAPAATTDAVASRPRTIKSAPAAAPVAIQPIAFGRSLEDALPFEPAVAAHLKQFGIVVVEPCFREHATWIAELNVDLLQHTSFRHAYEMTLGCFNDGGGRRVANPKPPSLPNGIYPSPSLAADEVFAFLEDQWQAMLRSPAELPHPPPAATKCHYLKDLSSEHDLRRRNTPSYFPKWDKALLEDQDRREAVVAASSLCGSAAAATDGDVVMRDVVPPVRYPALYMDAYAEHPKSLLRLTSTERCDGIHNSFAYLKFGFQFFNLHVEQWLLPFVHHQVSGESAWILVPHSERHKLSSVVRKMTRVRHAHLAGEPGQDHDDDATSSTVASVMFYSKSLLPPLSLLREHDVQFHQLQLRAGQVLVAHGGFAHYGFNTGAGETHAFACNIMTEDWLVNGGPQFVVQFFEGILDLSDLEPEELSNELAACGLDEQHLAKALNTCPPAYSCALLTAVRDDLQRHVSPRQDRPSPQVIYTLPLPQIRKALAGLDAALDLLHHADVRSFLERAYVVPKDTASQLCTCEPHSGAAAPETDDHLPERSIRRLYAAMERHHALVVGSGASGSKPSAERRTRGGRDVASPAAVEETKEMPISQTFGSVTAAPMSRVLDYLCSDAIQPPSLRLSSRNHFLDIGSGIGQVVLHVQLRFALASSTGIEYIWQRWDAGEKTLKALRDTTGRASPYDLASLRPALDDRLERVHFVHGRIEDQLALLSDATHVFMFDAAFHPHTHEVILPLLCVGHPRIVITCLSLERIRRTWSQVEGVPSLVELGRMYRLLTQMSLTMAGSGTTRVVYVYATHPR